MKKLIIFSLAMAMSFSLVAQLQIQTLGTTYTVDFDNTLQGVNTQAFESASQQAMFSGTAAAGSLDEAGWSVVLDNADTAVMNAAVFPGTGNAAFNTLITQGVSSTGWGAWNLSGDHALAMLPSGSWSTPAGHLTLKITNNSGALIDNLFIQYQVGAYNDQPRSNKVLFFYSFDNADYFKVPDASFYSSLASTSSWEYANPQINLNGVSIVNGQEFFLRWVFADHGGSGSRDEFWLDDIQINATGGGAPTPVQLGLLNFNNGVTPSVNEAFSLSVQSQNSSGGPTPVTADLPVNITLTNGTGTLSGTLQGTILSGTHTVIFNDLFYDMVESGITMQATATGLTPANIGPVSFFPAANHLEFTNFPATALTGNNYISYVPTFDVEARRPDNVPDSNYTGNISLTVFSGPGALLGTVSRSVQFGKAVFNDLQFDTPGTYILQADGPGSLVTLSAEINVLAGPDFNEQLVPQYFGSKHANSSNNCRTPFAICVDFTNLQPNTSYDIRLNLGLITEPVTSFGAGNLWNGTTFSGTNFANAFTTDDNGNTGILWFYIQPTGNASRFDAGQVHNIRAAVVPNGTQMPTTPMFIGSKTLTALDIPVTPRTTTTDDDGAFIKGVTSPAFSGKIFAIYNETQGTTDPLYCFQVRTLTAYSTFANAELPGEIDSSWRELPAGIQGEFAGVIPIGANNADGVKRVEIRNPDNSILAFQTDDDGIWPSGANAGTAQRREVVHLTMGDIPMSATITGTVTYANAAATEMDSTEVYLFDASNNVVMTAITDTNGFYTFNGVPNGQYSISAAPQKLAGGGNAIDALNILRHFVGMITLNGIFFTAGDVTGGPTPVVNSVDALMVQQRFVQMISTYPVGDWVSEKLPVTVDNTSTFTVDLKVLCAGDVNASFTPIH